MTDQTVSLSTAPVDPSQPAPAAPVDSPIKNEPSAKAEGAEEEPYTIKCICAFTDDDGNTIYCEACDTWQHIDCFYPNNRDEAIREDFAHACADCNPRPLDRKKAKERTSALARTVSGENIEKKAKRPPTKSHKKKPKPVDTQSHATNGPMGSVDHGKGGNALDQHQPKRSRSHKPSLSVGANPSKRSPTQISSKLTSAHPLSPVLTPPDLPDNFYIHTYTSGFRSLYDDPPTLVANAKNNAFDNLTIPLKLSQWLREPDTMRKEVGWSADEVFQDMPPNIEENKPKLAIEEASRQVPHLDGEINVRWRFIKSTSAVEKDVPLIELNGLVGFQADYCSRAENLWGDLSSPLPFVFFHPSLPLYIDTRKEGSLARYVRRSCKPNAQLDTYLSGSDYHFWLVSDRHIPPQEQITLPWDFRLDKSVGSRWLHLLGLSDEETPERKESDMRPEEYHLISNWIDRILSEYGGCACDLANDCAFARFHRQWILLKDMAERTQSGKSKKSRKNRSHTISPTSTGHATNSRAASEGQMEDAMDNDVLSQSGSTRSKPPSRERTPLRQGSLDKPGILTELTDREKRKVAMVEDSFRRMEQQQPPRKKKRVSDGTAASNSSKTKSRNGSAAPSNHYVDASSTMRRSSGSPASPCSPNPNNPHSTQPSRKPSASAHRPRPTSAALRPVYCDAAVQTLPSHDEWFCGTSRTPRTQKRVISLSRRLLNSKHRAQAEEDWRQSQAHSIPTPASTAMDMDSPTEQKPPIVASTDSSGSPKISQMADTPMADANSEAASEISADTTTSKNKAVELRVQMPPVPAFDSHGLSGSPAVSTPLSATGQVAQSPFSNSLVSPFTVAIANGATTQPSPVKKKLSLSDYTKSRMNKAAGKAPGSASQIKPGMHVVEEPKMDVSVDVEPTAVKPGESLLPVSTATTNGIA